MFNWFNNKEKTPVADLEEIKLEPEIVIPEKTRRELYDLAVLEVQHARVSELIKRELRDICVDPEVMADNKAAITHLKSNLIKTREGYLLIASMFPKIHTEATGELNFEEETNLSYQYSPYHQHGYYPIRAIVDPDISLDAFASRLATQYLSE